MEVQEVTPNVDSGTLLAGAQFVDTYRVVVDGTSLSARQAAEKIFARQPRWIEALLTLRNIMVAPFGLKTSGEGDPTPGGIIGLFPVVSEAPDRLIAGFNDSHLDFHVVADVTPSDHGQQVTAGAHAQSARPHLSHDHHAVPSPDRPQDVAARVLSACSLVLPRPAINLSTESGRIDVGCLAR
jgi:hypothetical protein